MEVLIKEGDCVNFLIEFEEGELKNLQLGAVSGSLPLAEMEKILDEALAKETPETLKKWLEEKRK